MSTTNGRWLAVALAAIALALFLAPSAQATLMLEVVQAGQADQIWVDNNLVPGPDPDGDGDIDTVNLDANATLGVLSIGGGLDVNVGGLIVSGSIHRSNQVGGPGSLMPGNLASVPPGASRLTSASVSVSNPTAAAITQTILVGDTDFSGPLHGDLFTTLSGTITNGSILIQSWDGPSNLQFANSAGAPSGNLDPGAVAGIPGAGFSFSNFTLNSLSFSADFGPVAYNFNDLYAKTIMFQLTLGPGGSLNNRGIVMTNTPIPEPATLGTAIMGVLGVALVARARRK